MLAVGNVEESVENLGVALELSDESAEALNNVGSVLAEHGEVALAADYYARSVGREPEYATGWRNLARARFALDESGAAVEAFDTLEALGELDPDSVWMRIDALEQADRIDEALERLAELERERPNDARVYRRRGMLLLNAKGRLAAAHRDFMKSLELNPNQPDLRLMLAQGVAPSEPEPGVNPREATAPPGVPQLPTPVLPDVP